MDSTPTQYMIPTEPHEVTVKELFKYLLDVDSVKPLKWGELEQETDPKNRVKLLSNMDDAFIERELKPYFVANASFWSGLSTKDCEGFFSVEELLSIYLETEKAISPPPKYIYQEVAQVNGVLYSLPGANMQDSILFQYAEADQEEQHLEQEGQHIGYILPRLMALLLRKENEPLFFTDKQVEERTALFEKATLVEAWGVFSYFQATKALVREKYGKTLFSEASREEKKAGAKQLQQAFGWMLTIKRLAEKKVFDIQGFNSQDSVLRTNTWECLTHLSCDNAISNYQERLSSIKTN